MKRVDGSLSIDNLNSSLSQDDIDIINQYLKSNNSDTGFVLRLYPKPQRQGIDFEGTVADYIDLVGSNRSLYRTAWESVYRAIRYPGIVPESEMSIERARIVSRQKLTVYRAFEGHFFMDAFIDKFVETIGSGATRGETSRNMIVILMPRGAGKTQFVRFIGHLLNIYSASEPIYYLADCDVRHDNPLWGIPLVDRSVYEKRLKIRIDDECDICLSCKMRLEKDYGGDLLRMPVKATRFDIKSNIGYGVISINDLGNQALYSKDQLFGSIDPRCDRNDPNRFIYRTAVHNSDCGVLEINEITSCKAEQFIAIDINRMTRQRLISSPAGDGTDFIDNVILATGQYDLRSVVESDKSIAGRIDIIKGSYALSIYDEKNIHRKLLRGVDVPIHVHGDTEDALAVVSIFSRLRDDISFLDFGIKMEIYSGIRPFFEKFSTTGSFKVYIDTLKNKYPDEGMFGFSPAFATSCLTKSLPGSVDKNPNLINQIKSNSRDDKPIDCLHWHKLLLIVREESQRHPDFKEKQDHIVKITDEAHKYIFDRLVIKMDRFLTYGFEDKINEIMENYGKNASLDIEQIYDNFRASNFKEKLDEKLEQFFAGVITARKEAKSSGKKPLKDVDPLSDDEQIDYNFMESIEKLVATGTDGSIDQWKAMYKVRRDFVTAYNSSRRRGRNLMPEDVPFFYTAVKKYLQQFYNMYKLADLLKDVDFEERNGQIIVLNRVYTPSEAQKFDELMTWMSKEEKYCTSCAIYTLNHLAKRLKSGNKKLKN